jgi:hypothetical protein
VEQPVMNQTGAVSDAMDCPLQAVSNALTHSVGRAARPRDKRVCRARADWTRTAGMAI